MDGSWVALADRPDLLAPAYAFSGDVEPGSAYMAHDLAGDLATAARIAQRWPQLLLALLMPDGSVAARAVGIPFERARPGRERLPDTGWDGVVHWAVADAIDGRQPDSCCALEIAIAQAYRGRGISVLAIDALRAAAKRLGLRELVAPVRPPGKIAEPFTPMESYATRTRDDGLPADGRLRTHVRAGGEILGIAPMSMVVVAPLAAWRAWTGLPFSDDGLVAVTGGLVPVIVSRDRDLGAYVEPNVWVGHPTAVR